MSVGIHVKTVVFDYCDTHKQHPDYVKKTEEVISAPSPNLYFIYLGIRIKIVRTKK